MGRFFLWIFEMYGIIIDNKKNLNLNLMCDGYDNNNDRFQINLKRNSVEDAGIGKAIYIN